MVFNGPYFYILLCIKAATFQIPFPVPQLLKTTNYIPQSIFLMVRKRSIKENNSIYCNDKDRQLLLLNISESKYQPCVCISNVDIVKPR